MDRHRSTGPRANASSRSPSALHISPLDGLPSICSFPHAEISMPAIINVSATLGAVLVGCFVAIACVDHPYLVCPLLTQDADSRELWASKHAFTFECTHLISLCTKLWCVILILNAPNTTTFRRSLWFGEQ